MIKGNGLVILVIAFLAGFVISDFLHPQPLLAEVRSILYDTLNAKILKVDSRVDSLQNQVNKMQANDNKLQTAVKTLASAVKEVQKTSSNEKEELAVDKTQLQVQETLAADVTGMKISLDRMKEVIRLQQQAINDLEEQLNQ